MKKRNGSAQYVVMFMKVTKLLNSVRNVNNRKASSKNW